MITSEKIQPWLIGFLLGILILTISGSMFFFFLFQDRIYPGVKIDEIDVSGLTKDQAQQLLKQELKFLPEYSIVVKIDNIKLASSSSQLKIKREYNLAIAQAYEMGRVGFPLKKIWTLTKATFNPLKFKTHLTYDQTELNNFIQELKNQVDLIGHNPKAILNYSGYPSSLIIDEGKPGRKLLDEETAQLMLSNIGNAQALEAEIASTSTILNEEQIIKAREKASKLINKRLILRAENVRLDLNDQKLISLLEFPEGFNQEIMTSLLESWKDVVSRPAQNAEFEFNQETLIVDKFIPHREGLELDQTPTIELLTNTINNFTTKDIDGTPIGIHNQSNFELDLPVKTTQPKITLADINDLGINERIGFGESEYDYSIVNRIHNVALTTAKISDIIIPPGKQFSFNKALGEVSARNGFRSAYVIKDGRTELGDGGGVCQVSTTTFRAVLDAGLEVTLRLPHSYRVSYYELNSKPGIDATVYAGNTDLRFINDTNHHILIRGETDSKNLYMKMEIYGTSDGRTTEIKDHKVWGYISPPPPEYYPDPSLPTGTKKQIDWAVGGVKAKFTHVIRNASGEITSEKIYSSNYRPWAAKYLVDE